MMQTPIPAFPHLKTTNGGRCRSDSFYLRVVTANERRLRVKQSLPTIGRPPRGKERRSR